MKKGIPAIYGVGPVAINSKIVTYPPIVFFKVTIRGLSARAAVLCNGAPNRKSGNVVLNHSAH